MSNVSFMTSYMVIVVNYYFSNDQVIEFWVHKPLNNVSENVIKDKQIWVGHIYIETTHIQT